MGTTPAFVALYLTMLYLDVATWYGGRDTRPFHLKQKAMIERGIVNDGERV